MMGLGRKVTLAALSAIFLWGCGDPVCGNGNDADS